MVRKDYNLYEYIDPDDQYTFSNSSVLKKKFGITDESKAHEMEHNVYIKRGLDLVVEPFEVKRMKDVKKIHGYLFQDIYHWAGQYREVNISKTGHAFMAMQAFDTGEEYMDSLIRKFLDTAQSKFEIVTQLAEILDNLNHMHPFREGNGRTQREVIRSLALVKGYYAEIDLDIDDKVYNLYMDGTVHGDTSKLIDLFDLIIEPIEEDE